LRALHKAEAIVREEMNRAGAVELRMPCLTPTNLWEESGRLDTMQDILLRIDRGIGEWATQLVLGPTHEEIITEIARAYLKSYKQLPCNLYQIQLKFRGEARPKSGVLRTREFLMKDAYSFHSDHETLDTEYENMYGAYCRIFGRCGLPYTAVQAESGAMGGDVSHEFMVLTDAGEDLVAITPDGKYAANLERAAAAFDGQPEQADMADLAEVHTPGAGKVEDVCGVLGTQPRQMIKTLIYTEVVPEEDTKKRKTAPAKVVALVRGDHEMNDFKLAKVAGLPLELATPAVIEEITGASVGFAGPQTLIDKIDKLVIDRDVTVMRNAASGANKTDYHVTGVNPGRDFPLEGDKVVVGDIRNVVEGDIAPDGSGQPLALRKAIEIGHVFKLGTKYSVSMKADYLDANGKAQPLIMGCYGIGVNRIMAAAIESNHDDNGIIWPVSIAPFEVLVVALDPRDDEASKVAHELHDKLAAAGIDVLLDDRDERAGFKFKDADLIGIPLRLVVGKRSLQAGGVEVSRRAAVDDKQVLPPDEAVKHAVQFVRTERTRLAAG
jgi:prolyl-tRNA synthetase